MTTATSVDVLTAFPARYCAAWSQDDLATFLDVISPEVRWEDPLLPEPFVGHEGATGFFQGARLGFPDMAFELVGEPLVDEANGRVSAEWVMTGTHTGEFPPGAPVSGNSFRVPGSDTWEVDADGRATSVHAHYDTLTLLKAIGLA
ncbi:ester cyclase [Patulibacter minatonensis]|uniref:ester cyclase n=1 Tax=Patulibacter minatonensis TaxID=298163 RepID=UPI0004799662|nr:nuclear transport factor 2 family protein [Patulibacter minatonensis]